MDFVTVEGRALKHALRVAIETCDRGARIPVLACVRLRLTREGLEIEATDLDVTVRVHLDVIDGAGEWETCLPAHLLDGIAKVAGVMPVRIAPGSPATVTLGEEEAVYSLDPLPAADFPETAIARGEPIETFSNGMLVAFLDKVRCCISQEETRYYLNGVCWSHGARGARFAATDGHRMAVCTYGEASDEAASRIIPRKSVRLLVRHLGGQDVRAYAAKGGKPGLVFETDGLTLSTKLIDGAYPDIDRVIPDGGGAPLALKRAEFAAAIARLVALGGRHRVVKFEPRDGRLALERHASGGVAQVKTSSDWPQAGGTAEALKPFGVNGSYMADLLRGCEGDIALAVTSPSDPLLIRDSDATMTRVLMPMRV